MTIDITSFHKVNIIDSCSIWNILCCNLFYSRALENQCEFSITKYVEYECLYKPRSNESSFDTEIKKRLHRNINISAVHVTLYRLEDKGYLKSEMGASTHVRGGRRKRIFTITNAGLSALRVMKSIRLELWKLIPQLRINH